MPKTVRTISVRIERRGQSESIALKLPNAERITHIDVQAKRIFGMIQTNGLYFGSAAAGKSDTAGLSREELAQPYGYFEASTPAGDKAYFAHPKRWGVLEARMGNVSGHFNSPTTIAVNDIGGYSEDYYLYESIQEGLSGRVFISARW